MDLSALCLWGLADLCGLAGLPVCICRPPWWAGMLYACSLGEEAASDEDNSEAACSSRHACARTYLPAPLNIQDHAWHTQSATN